jgi:hypothetical protein
MGTGWADASLGVDLRTIRSDSTPKERNDPPKAVGARPKADGARPKSGRRRRRAP